MNTNADLTINAWRDAYLNLQPVLRGTVLGELFVSRIQCEMADPEWEDTWGSTSENVCAYYNTVTTEFLDQCRQNIAAREDGTAWMPRNRHIICEVLDVTAGGAVDALRVTATALETLAAAISS